MGFFKRKNKKIEENIETNSYIEEDSMKAELNDFLDDGFDVSASFGNGNSNSFSSMAIGDSKLDTPLEIDDNFSFFGKDEDKKEQEKPIQEEPKKLSNLDILKQFKPNNIKQQAPLTSINKLQANEEVKKSTYIEPIKNDEQFIQKEKPSFVEEKPLEKTKSSILKSSKSLNLNRDSIIKKMNEKNYKESQQVEEKKKTCEFIAIDENYVFPEKKTFIPLSEKDKLEEDNQEEVIFEERKFSQMENVEDISTQENLQKENTKEILKEEYIQDVLVQEEVSQEEHIQEVVQEIIDNKSNQDNKLSVFSLFNQDKKDSENLLGSFFSSKKSDENSLFSLFEDTKEESKDESLLDMFEEDLQKQEIVPQEEYIQEEIVKEEVSQEEYIQEEIVQEEVPQEEYIQEEIIQEEVSQEEYIQEEIVQEEVSQEEYIQEEIVQEEVPQEEYIQEEIVQEEVPQEEYIQEEIIQEIVPQDFSLLNQNETNLSVIEEVIEDVVEEVLDKVGIEDLRIDEIVEEDEPIDKFIQNTSITEISDDTSSLIDNLVSNMNEENLLSAANAVNKEKYNYLKAKRKSLLKTRSLLDKKTTENKPKDEEIIEVVEEENHFNKFIAIDEEFDSSIFKEKEVDYSDLNNKFNPYLNLSEEEKQRKKEELRLQRENSLKEDKQEDEELLKEDEIVNYESDSLEPLMIEDKTTSNFNEENLDVIPLNKGLDDKEEIYTTNDYSKFNENTKKIDKSDIYEKKLKDLEINVKGIDFNVIVDYAEFISSYRKLRKDYLNKKKEQEVIRKREAIRKMQEMEEAKKARAMVEKEDAINQQHRDMYGRSHPTLIGDISENNHDRLMRLRVQAANREEVNDDLVFGKYKYKDSELSLSELNNKLPRRALYDEYVIDDYVEEVETENLSPNRNTFSNGNIRPPKS